MPLSEDEQRILQEIEANLSATDPALVQQVSETTLYRHAARAIKWAVAGFLAGLVLLILTFATSLVLGIAGFLVMLACLLVIERNARASSARPGSTTSPAHCGAVRSRACSAMPVAAGVSAGAATTAEPRRRAWASPRSRRRGSRGALLRRSSRGDAMASSSPSRPRAARRGTRSATSSRCGWCRHSSTPDCRFPASGVRCASSSNPAKTSPGCAW